MGDRRTKREIELQDLLLRLKAIEKEMPQEELEKKKKKKTDKVDRFMEAKTQFLEGMSQVKDALREMKQNKGTARTRDQIARAQEVRNKLKDLSKLFQEMETLYSKEARKRRQKLSAEELEARGQFLSQFKQDLEALKRLSSKSFSMGNDDPFDTRATSSGVGFDTASFFQSLPEKETQGSTGGFGSGTGREVELTEMQQQSLDQIRARDEQFDLVLDQIGIAIEAAGEKAKAMQDITELHNKMLDNIEEEIGKTQEKMNTINVSMKKSLDESGGAERFCINCMCFIFLLGIIGVIVNFIS